MEPIIKRGARSLSFVGRVQWLRQGTEREELCVWMDRIRTTMLIVLVQIAIESSQIRESEKTQVKMRSLFEDVRSEQ